LIKSPGVSVVLHETPRVAGKQFVLPSIPKVVALLLTELGRPEVDLRKVTRLISTDPALTTRLLQLANSGLF
jgi:HD-like signal output (HDOD) protein